MNVEPTDAVRVAPAELEAFAYAVCRAWDLPEPRARLLARLLVQCDLRGTFSHGTQLLGWYADWSRHNGFDPHAPVTVERETPVSLLLDGHGGLGYFPLYEGTLALIEKAKASGIGVLVTRNHEHIGAAGHYARLPLGHDLMTFVTTGHQMTLDRRHRSDRHMALAGGGSAMAFSAPALEEDAFVLDFGPTHNLYDHAKADELARLAPGMVLRAIGMGEVCQIWGGLLAGLPGQSARNPRWKGKGRELEQGAMVFMFRIDLFMDPAVFRRELDAYIREVHKLDPLPGFSQALLAGGIEAQRERRFPVEGIPLGPEHRRLLRKVARQYGLEAPFAEPPAH